MAIIGLTHNENGKLENKSVKYKGKISTGWGPNEGPNKANHPIQAGHFIAMVEQTVNQRVGNKVVPVTKWSLNKEVQATIEKLPGNDKTPRILEVVCLYREPEDFWDSYLAMYNAEGLVCRGGGSGTEATRLEYDADGERSWIKMPCEFPTCEHYISGACKARGSMKIYPTADATPPNPYRFDTSSINTINNIESALDDIWQLVRTAHAVKEMEAEHQLPFDGMFGMKFYLVLKKKKSGGRDVFVTELMASKDFKDNIMKVISRAITKKSEVQALEGESGTLSLLDAAATTLMKEEAEPAEAIEMKEPDETDVAATSALLGDDED